MPCGKGCCDRGTTPTQSSELTNALASKSTSWLAPLMKVLVGTAFVILCFVIRPGFIH